MTSNNPPADRANSTLLRLIADGGADINHDTAAHVAALVLESEGLIAKVANFKGRTSWGLTDLGRALIAKASPDADLLTNRTDGLPGNPDGHHRRAARLIMAGYLGIGPDNQVFVTERGLAELDILARYHKGGLAAVKGEALWRGKPVTSFEELNGEALAAVHPAATAPADTPADPPAPARPIRDAIKAAVIERDGDGGERYARVMGETTAPAPFKLTGEKRRMARHALGLDTLRGAQHRRSYRNRYITPPEGDAGRGWREMCEAGLAEEGAGGEFWLTLAGALAALDSDEALCSEDFPEAWDGSVFIGDKAAAFAQIAAKGGPVEAVKPVATGGTVKGMVEISPITGAPSPMAFPAFMVGKRDRHEK